ncbi:unnamed protein product [Amoebophrya sp. A120]|nr:unnamed protein product [Amoebophrya sp. A120]|eukprot:GSA120T00005271001.1
MKERDALKQTSTSGSSPTYGEITAEGLHTLFANVGKLDGSDVFYDLGSGVGRAVMRTYLNYNVKKAVGIEYSKTRHERALEGGETLLAHLRNDTTLSGATLSRLLDGTKSFEFRHADFLQTNLSDATLIYTCSACFSPELLDMLHTKVVKECPKLRYLISVRRLSLHTVSKKPPPGLEDSRKLLVEKFVDDAKFSWSDHSYLRFYAFEERNATRVDAPPVAKSLPVGIERGLLNEDDFAS